MNKVLLDFFPTQISDERGSKKIKKIIFSALNFFSKIYKFFIQQNFYQAPRHSKQPHNQFLNCLSRFSTFIFAIFTQVILELSARINFSTLKTQSIRLCAFTDRVEGKSTENFCRLNFQN